MATAAPTNDWQRDLEEEVLMALRRITRAISLHSRHIQQACGLTRPQLLLLRELAKRGEATGGELARAVSLSNPTVTGILERLERSAIVTRTRSPEDKRRVINRLTPKGEDVLGNAPAPLQDQFLESFREIPHWEQALLLSSLQRVAHMMEAQDLDVAPVLTDEEGEVAD